MTKTKQISVLCRIVNDYRRENRQLKKEKQQLAAEVEEAHSSALFWRQQAERLLREHPTMQEVREIFAAGAVPPQKQRLFTSD